MTEVKTDCWNGDDRVINDAKEIFIPPGLYRVSEITAGTCTIVRLPAADGCLFFRFHQTAPKTWYLGAVVECWPNAKSRTGRTIQLRESKEAGR